MSARGIYEKKAYLRTLPLPDRELVTVALRYMRSAELSHPDRAGNRDWKVEVELASQDFDTTTIYVVDEDLCNFTTLLRASRSSIGKNHLTVLERWATDIVSQQVSDRLDCVGES